MSTRQNPSFCIVLCGNRAPPALYNIRRHHNRGCCVYLCAFLHSLLRRTSVVSSTTLVSTGTCVHPHVALNNPGSRKKTRLFNGNSSYRQFRRLFFLFFSERPTKKHFVTHTAGTGQLPRARERPAHHWYLLSTATQLVLQGRISPTTTAVLRGRPTAASQKTSSFWHRTFFPTEKQERRISLENTATKPHTPVSSRCSPQYHRRQQRQ